MDLIKDIESIFTESECVFCCDIAIKVESKASVWIPILSLCCLAPFYTSLFFTLTGC